MKILRESFPLWLIVSLNIDKNRVLFNIKRKNIIWIINESKNRYNWWKDGNFYEGKQLMTRKEKKWYFLTLFDFFILKNQYKVKRKNDVFISLLNMCTHL